MKTFLMVLVILVLGMTNFWLGQQSGRIQTTKQFANPESRTIVLKDGTKLKSVHVGDEWFAVANIIKASSTSCDLYINEAGKRSYTTRIDCP